MKLLYGTPILLLREILLIYFMRRTARSRGVLRRNKSTLAIQHAITHTHTHTYTHTIKTHEHNYTFLVIFFSECLDITSKFLKYFVKETHTYKMFRATMHYKTCSLPTAVGLEHISYGTAYELLDFLSFIAFENIVLQSSLNLSNA